MQATEGGILQTASKGKRTKKYSKRKVRVKKWKKKVSKIFFWFFLQLIEINYFINNIHFFLVFCL